MTNGLDFTLCTSDDCKVIRSALKGHVKATVRVASGLVHVRPRGGRTARFESGDVALVLNEVAGAGYVPYANARPTPGEQYGAPYVTLCKPVG